MNEFSCTSVSAFGAARPDRAPNMAPAPDNAVIFSTSRRDVARTILAIAVSLWRCPDPTDVMRRDLPKSTLPRAILAQQELPPDLHHGHIVISHNDDVPMVKVGREFLLRKNG